MAEITAGLNEKFTYVIFYFLEIYIRENFNKIKCTNPFVSPEAEEQKYGKFPGMQNRNIYICSEILVLLPDNLSDNRSRKGPSYNLES